MENIEKTAIQIKKAASKRARAMNERPKGIHYYPGWCLIDTRNEISKKEAFKLYLKSISVYPGVYLGYLLGKLLLVEDIFNCCSDKDKNITDTDLEIAKEYLFLS